MWGKATCSGRQKHYQQEARGCKVWQRSGEPRKRHGAGPELPGGLCPHIFMDVPLWMHWAFGWVWSFLSGSLAAESEKVAVMSEN